MTYTVSNGTLNPSIPYHTTHWGHHSWVGTLVIPRNTLSHMVYHAEFIRSRLNDTMIGISTLPPKTGLLWSVFKVTHCEFSLVAQRGHISKKARFFPTAPALKSSCSRGYQPTMGSETRMMTLSKSKWWKSLMICTNVSTQYQLTDKSLSRDETLLNS